MLGALTAPFRRPLAFLRCAVPSILAVVLTNAIGYAMTGGRFRATETGLRFVFSAEQSWIVILLSVISIGALVMFALAWQRQVFFGREAEPAPLFRFDVWLWQYLLMGLKLLGFMIVPGAIALLVVVPVIGPVPSSLAAAVLPIAVAIGFAAAVWWYVGRFSVAIGSAAVDRPPIGFRESWRVTASLQAPITCLFLCIGLVDFCVSLLGIHVLHTVVMPIGFGFSLLPFILFGLGNLAFSLIQTGWIVGAAALVYRRLSDAP